MTKDLSNISWRLIDKYFKDNPSNLVAHHLDSYNDFYSSGINNIFRENNPIRFIEREEKKKAGEENDGEMRNECSLYLGGKDGNRIYFGKPIIYDDNDKGAHYMYPNDARLRNMTYGITIHYDVEVDFVFFEGEERKTHSILLKKVYLGRFPIMLQSNLCILSGLTSEVRYNMGECKNDYGGYFIIDGKEKVIVPQEKFANNMLYIKKNKEDDTYSHSAEIRSVSEDASKPIRTMAIKIVAPTTVLSNNQMVVTVPNVRKPVPLFILMRALGVVSDKSIIEYCLLDLKKNEPYIDLFIPSIHDAIQIFNQETALKYIASFTKRRTITGVLDILMNYFLPHIGEKNFLDKAYYIGYMVNRLLRVYTKDDKPTDRDNFRFKRIEMSGTLIYDLFREYYLIQHRNIGQKIDKEYYYHKGKYKQGFLDLINEDNYNEFFKERVVEAGFRKAFKGNWGSEAHTKRVGVVQDLNRLSWNSFISQLRKLNLPLDASAKVVGPRLLNSSQWGFIDPIDTPDGGNIGLHKHMAISTLITSGYSCWPLIKWLRSKTAIRILQECTPEFLGSLSKVIVNGVWIGGIENPLELVKLIKLFRRNGIIPVYTSVSFDYENNEIYIYSDGGRLTRPVYYMEKKDLRDFGKPSFERKEVLEKILDGDFSWQEIVSGFKEKGVKDFNYKKDVLYDLEELYPDLNTLEKVEQGLEKFKSVVDYVDTSEEEGLLFATTTDDLKKNKYYTNLEVDPSLILGVMGNQIIYPENNPVTRNSFSCGQSKQAVSVYHSNYQMRIDKMGVVLNNGQIPLVKSRYLEYINNEQQPYGVNAIVAIMTYTGYNVEDAILINEGSVKRGIFNTTYYSMYEAREESSKVSGSTTNSYFADVAAKPVVKGIKPGFDYSHLDKYGIIRENVALNDEMVIIGQVSSSTEDSDVVTDSSVFPKKGQLGFVDKSFITEGEEGFRIAKVRVREERLPAIGDKMACALPTQQVLTSEGWIEIKDIDISKHKLATLDENENMCYEHPINKFEYNHNGKMYYVKNKQVEVVCTLNHKLYVKRREKLKGEKEYELLEAEKVIGKMVRFQKSMKNVYPDVEYMILGEKKYKMDDWLQLLGMFIADGSVNNRAVVLSAHKQRKVNFNIDFLTKLRIEYYHDNHNGYFAINLGTNKEIYEELKKYSLGALNKYLPEYVWSLSQRQCIILLEALMEGDGHTYSDGFSRYGTISLKLANDVCRLAVHCGWSGVTKIAAEPGDNKHIITGKSGYNKGKSHMIESKNTYYKISIIRKQNQPYINKKVNDSNEEKLIDYEGKVYCVEMPSSHLYYMRENNLAPSMLIGNSRAGQKGTLGLIIPEEDMPFCADGTRPDLIINPHALPSRMTIGQLVECLLGKVCVSYGGFGDCTAFQTKGPNTKIYGEALTNAGFHSSGNQILYNGMTGEQLYSEIYMGPTYYMRLKHMVKDKINYRARGPNTQLTRQPVQGRANDGGLRIGEMERDGVMAHGASAFLNDSFMVRGDEYYMAVCNKTGCTAIYNEALNLFLSPFADGPVKFKGTMDGKLNIDNISRFGRSFSVVRIPYSLKLLIQELQVMNIQMRIITEDNIDQLMNMSYSDNINKLLQTDSGDITKLISDYKNSMLSKIRKADAERNAQISKNTQMNFQPTPPSEESVPYATGSPAYRPGSDDSMGFFETGNSPQYAPGSPPYAPGSPAYEPTSPAYEPTSPAYNPNSPVYSATSPPYAPGSPAYTTAFVPHSPEGTPPPRFVPSSPEEPPPQMLREPNIKNPELKAQFEELPEPDKKLLIEMLDKKKAEKATQKVALAAVEPTASVLELEQPKSTESESEQASEGESQEKSSGGSSNAGQTKSISISPSALEG